MSMQVCLDIIIVYDNEPNSLGLNPRCTCGGQSKCRSVGDEHREKLGRQCLPKDSLCTSAVLADSRQDLCCKSGDAQTYGTFGLSLWGMWNRNLFAEEVATYVISPEDPLNISEDVCTAHRLTSNTLDNSLVDFTTQEQQPHEGTRTSSQ